MGGDFFEKLSGFVGGENAACSVADCINSSLTTTADRRLELHELQQISCFCSEDALFCGKTISVYSVKRSIIGHNAIVTSFLSVQAC